MEMNDAVRALAALAQESRLAVFRSLVRSGPAGIAAGTLAEQLEIPSSTLSFHLQHLAGAGLVRAERQGRSLVYSLRPETLQELLWFVGEDCCQGRTELCAAPAGRIGERRREAATPVLQPRVLFVCSRNSARSQMAEALLRRAAPERLWVASAGIAPSAVHPLTTQVLREIGLVDQPLAAKDLGQFLGKVPIHYAIIVCEAANAHCPRMVPFALHTLYWPFADPVAITGSKRVQLRQFRATRDAIAERIEQWVAQAPWEQPSTKAPASRRAGGQR